jgi:hypothetical protein
MKRIIAATAALILTTSIADARIYAWMCNVKGRSGVVKVDDATRVLTWQGVRYRTTDAFEVQTESPPCAKGGWYAEPLNGGGVPFFFCYATQGNAYFADQSGALVYNTACLQIVR